MVEHAAATGWLVQPCIAGTGGGTVMPPPIPSPPRDQKPMGRFGHVWFVLVEVRLCVRSGGTGGRDGGDSMFNPQTYDPKTTSSLTTQLNYLLTVI
jgi:hypothetical protein